MALEVRTEPVELIDI